MIQRSARILESYLKLQELVAVLFLMLAVLERDFVVISSSRVKNNFKLGSVPYAYRGYYQGQAHRYEASTA